MPVNNRYQDAYAGLLLLAGSLAGATLSAQTYVTPMMGGGQTVADMVHIDVYYDAYANQLSAQVDDSYGIPELRALEAGYAFDPEAPYGVLNGRAYNSQYGWNVGGFFRLPPGAAIWIELTDCTPGLETYSGWGQTGTYAPIFGTGGSPRLWKWSGVMVHNTYAVSNSPIGRLFADYHIYFGDANTGSRTNFTELDDTTVRLEWTVVPVEDPMTFKFGAMSQTNGAPLCFLNAGQFVTNSQAVMNFRHTNAGPWALQYECAFPMLAVPATDFCGGPASNSAAPGAHLELQLVSLAGPPQGALSFWEAGQSEPRFTLPTGALAATNRLVLSENSGAPQTDPYGYFQGRHFAVNRPGLYCLGCRVVDTSTNGPGGGPIHTPSPLYHVYLQAGLSIISLTRQGSSATALYGGEPGRTFWLERSSGFGPSASWQTVAGPVAGTNRLQTLTDPAAVGSANFYLLRAQ